MPNRSRFALCLLASSALSLATLTGCGSSFTTTASPVAVASSLGLSGTVFGGQQPVNMSSINLYAVGTSGNGKGAQSLLVNPVTTNRYGGFRITGDYTCPANSYVYLTATGGNPGLSANTNNAALAMMVPLGLCANLTTSTFVQINEVTTVAAVWALQQFMASGAQIGSSATNTNGIADAMNAVTNLVSIKYGFSPGDTLPAGATVPTAKLYTLADVIAGCINSDGNGACGPLFSAATVNGVVPTNTIDAALAIVRNPAHNVTAVFNAGPALGPFQPTLNNAPPDWTLSITYSGNGLNLPTAIALDSTGAVWVANYYGSASKFTNAGQPASGSPFYASSLNEIYGLTVDGRDNVWLASQETTNGTNNNYGAITEFSSSGSVLSGSGFAGGGTYYPEAVAADLAGNIWVADYGDSTSTLLASDGSAISPSSGYAPGLISSTASVALDGGAAGSQTAWYGARQAIVNVTPSGSYTVLKCCSGPTGIAVDQNGFIWVSDFSASAVVQLSPTGNTLATSTSGGVTYPYSIAIDSAGSIWVANYRGASLSAFTGSSSPTPGTALSPAAGLGSDAGLAEPYKLALDSSGDIWVTNAGMGVNTITEFLGLAAPVQTPNLGPPVAP